MGNIVLNDIETRYNNNQRFIDINLTGLSNPHLNLMKHCKWRIFKKKFEFLWIVGSLADVRKMFDKFKTLCQGKNYKYVTKRTLHEILPFSITTNCRIYDHFNVKSKRTYSPLTPLQTGLTSTNSSSPLFGLHTPTALRKWNVQFFALNLVVLFRLVDGQNQNEWHYEDLHEVIKWTLKGISRFFFIQVPKGKELSILSYKAFVSADATNDNMVDFTELVNWVELN